MTTNIVVEVEPKRGYVEVYGTRMYYEYGTWQTVRIIKSKEREMEPKYTPEEYAIAFELMRRRLAGMSERLVNMEKEVQRERREWLNAVQRMQNPNMHAFDAEKMYDFLQELHEAIRELLKVENTKWGLGTYSQAIDKPLKKQRLAIIMCRVLDYFDWDDE